MDASRKKTQFRKFVNSYPQANAWMTKYNLESMLDKGGGIVKISNFLPGHVADGALDMLSTIPPGRWNWTAAQQDYAHNNIDHKFWSTKHSTGLLDVFRVLMDTGQVETCSRDIAVIYYLTKDWKEEYGGVLIDLETGARYTPEYNSAICFRIPRWHEVTQVSVNRSRYSIFGWFLQPGILYDLNTGTKPAAHIASLNQPSPAGLSGGHAHPRADATRELPQSLVAGKKKSGEHRSRHTVDRRLELVKAPGRRRHRKHCNGSQFAHSRLIPPAPSVAAFRIHGGHPISVRVGKRLWLSAIAASSWALHSEQPAQASHSVT